MEVYLGTAAACQAGNSQSCRIKAAYADNVEYCAGLDNSSSRPVVTGVSREPSEPKIAKDRSSDLVREVQFLLSAAGFDPGSQDGLAGPATCEAARRFAVKQSTGVGCHDLIGLRKALSDAVADHSANEAISKGCGGLIFLTPERVVSTWAERQKKIVDLLQEQVDDLEKQQHEVNNFINKVGVIHVVNQTSLATKAVAKLSLGGGAIIVGAVAGFAAAQPLLVALAVVTTAEAADTFLRDIFGREMLHRYRLDFIEIDSGYKLIDQIVSSIKATVEGIAEINELSDNGNKLRSLKYDLESAINTQTSLINKVKIKINNDKSYLIFLRNVQDSIKMCGDIDKSNSLLTLP
jgi:hypothetical protein